MLIAKRARLSSAVALALAAVAVTAVLAPSSQAHADTIDGPLAQSDFGGVGLLQTPTARMNPYGELSINYSDADEYRRTAVSLQLLPWLTATARYTDIRYRKYSSDTNFSGDQTYKDKGFDAKILLAHESKYLPQLAVGLQDVGGTGIFAGEYLVANKRFSTSQLGSFDVSLGMGWGYLGRRDNIRNPFCEVADRMCERDQGFSGSGGKFEVDKWFRGPAAVFGGVQYYTPIDGLSLMAEYDPNDYQLDNAGRDIDVDSPWNLGAHYAYNDTVSFKLGYERGNTVTFGVTFNYNFNKAYQLKVEPAKRIATSDTVTPASISDVDYQKLANDLLTESGWKLAEDTGSNANTSANANTTAKAVELKATQTRFRDTEEAIDRAARILADSLPEQISEYRITEYEGNLGKATHVINAAAYKAAYRGERLLAVSDNAIRTTSTAPSQQPVSFKQDKFSWAIEPDLDQSFGGAEDFYMYQLSLKASADYQFNDAFSVGGRIGINLANSYDKFNYLLDSQGATLPRVRTRIREYAVNQDLWLDNFSARYTEHLGRNLYGQVYAGYLERMFGGLGAEVLHQAPNSNWAYGVDINYAKQRDPYKDLGFDDYHVLTGHASVYWDTPWLANTTVIARAGRFLAKDEGVHLEFQHEFDSGVIAGAFAAFTNVSDEEYGEGSFTKGFYLSIPFDLFFVRNTKTRGTLGWLPILRDGGQMLGRPHLYK
ncbi:MULTISPECIES: YjbH domain-containing protein [Pseudidiomarina]|uniref:Exopolysaccharide biosynthesis protein YbjH n=2 Tax=Pseudidiomarina TaxID=2800384 RepID=A0A368UMH6_9GAMM|nr:MULTISPECIES: YjbH domain-containing protein [Pseudidiomarina]PWW10373.1 exopolysaccharide biosynthesis protein YbjH [Pseudidiomarina maritima]RBP87922.1 exopolysaccharide biosynthesis protein YbjH [Pseudidiomarina tainanensis]RCW29959.1 exopolysaccharide biosynthesis protein YbjH [Pseudidiomarina tainanensis]